MAGPEVLISDHALVRYLERKYEYSLDAFREEIRAAVRDAVKVGATAIYLEGFTYMLAGATVVTIVEGRKRNPDKTGVRR